MEYAQPWSQQRPNYPSGNGYRPNPPGVSQRMPYTSQMQAGAAKPTTLSREERQEAKRLAEEASFSFYHVL